MPKQVRLSDGAAKKLGVLVMATPGMTVGAVVDMAFDLVTPRALQEAVIAEVKRKMEEGYQPTDTGTSGSDRTATRTVASGRSGGQNTETAASDRPAKRSDRPAAPAVGAGRSRSPEQDAGTADPSQRSQRGA